MDADLEAQFRRMGVEITDLPEASAEPEAFEVMAQNADSLQLWLAVETQWRLAIGLGGSSWLGLDYSAVDVVLRRVGLSKARANEVFGDLMVMEAAALSTFGEKQ